MVKVGNSELGYTFTSWLLSTFASFDLDKKMKRLDVRNSKTL